MNHQESYEFFPPEAVDEWVRTKMSDYSLNMSVATLDIGETGMAPAVLTKFAALALELKGEVSATYQSLAVKKRRPEKDIREAAIREMRGAMERGEIDEKGHAA